MRTKLYLEGTSGSSVILKEFTTRDLIPTLHILNNCRRDAIDLYVKWDQYGRKRQPVAEVFGAKVFNHFMHIVMNRLMESDRLLLPGDLSLFIGRTDKKKQTIVNYRKKSQLYFASRGRRYGVVLHGKEHKYFFRMPSRRRTELSNRIKRGQNFYNQY